MGAARGGGGGGGGGGGVWWGGFGARRSPSGGVSCAAPGAAQCNAVRCGVVWRGVVWCGASHEALERPCVRSLIGGYSARGPRRPSFARRRSLTARAPDA
ncbi:hypothetical protein D8O05_23840 [Burkholderia mallei]|nr:hypothetical protein D8O05_23840 [Burkholderia mallei]